MNPVHDLDRFDDFVNYNPRDSKSVERAIRETPAFGLNTLKHVVRGAFGGALVGAVYSGLTNTNLSEGIEFGATAGAAVDSVQYWLRGYLLRSH